MGNYASRPTSDPDVVNVAAVCARVGSLCASCAWRAANERSLLHAAASPGPMVLSVAVPSFALNSDPPYPANALPARGVKQRRGLVLTHTVRRMNRIY